VYGEDHIRFESFRTSTVEEDGKYEKYQERTKNGKVSENQLVNKYERDEQKQKE